MASTYTLNNGIELIGTGEQSGTWGDTTNDNLQFIDTALDGQVTITATSAGTSGSPNTLPIADGQSLNSEGRNRMVIITSATDLGSTVYYQLTPNDAEKIIYIRNDLNAQDLIVFQGTYNSSNDYVVPNGTTAVIYFNGNGSGAVAANVFNNAYFDSLRLGSVSVTAILDEDDMSSDSATALATQQSIKAYVDTQITAEDLDFAGDSGTGAVDLDSQTFTIAGTANEIETSASGQTLTVGLPDDVTIANSLTVDGAVDVNGATGFDIQTTNTNPIFERTDAEVKIATRHSGTTTTQYYTDTGGSLSLRADPTNALASTFFNITVDGTQALRIDSAQRTIVGGLTSVITTAGSTPTFQVLGSSFPESSMVLGRGALNANASGLNFVKSRNNNFGGNTILADNDQAMYIAAYGDDGTDYNTPMATIVAEVDGTPGANDMPGRIRFSTTADGANSVTERMRIHSSGDISMSGSSGTVGTLKGRGSLTISDNHGDNTGGAVAFHYTGNGGYSEIYIENNNTLVLNADPTAAGSNTSIKFRTDDTLAAMIDDNQRLLIGGTSSVGISGYDNYLQLKGTGGAAAGLSIQRYNNGAGGGVLNFGKTRSTTVGTVGTVVQDGDALGYVLWAGDDGTDITSNAAWIFAAVDGTPGANDMPGRLVFSTTSDGAVTPTERMRIDNAGLVTIGSGGGAITPLRISNTVSDTIDLDKTYNVAPKGAWLELHNPGGTTGGGVGISALGLGAEGRYAAIAMTDQTSDNSGTGGDIEFWASSSKTGALVEAMRIDGSGNVLFNVSSPRTLSSNPFLQLEGTDAGQAAFSVTRSSNDASSGSIRLAKSRSTTKGGHTVVQDGDYLGAIYFMGDDGTDDSNFASGIWTQVDGTPLSGGDGSDMPGRLVFATTADGTNSAVERMRINNRGVVGIDKTPPIITGNVGSALFVGNQSIFQRASTSTYYATNFYYDSSDVGKSLEAGYSMLYQQDAANRLHAWYSSTQATGADQTVSISEIMRLNDSSLCVSGLDGTFTNSYGSATRTNLQIDGSSEAIITMSHAGTVAGYINTNPGSSKMDISSAIGGFRFLPSGATSNKVEIDTNGNIVFPSGQGIDFSATAGPTNGTSTSELLDDYEEGEFSPFLGDASANDLYSTYGSALGSYVKVGALVHCNVWISANSSNRNFTNATAIRLHGLPYTVNSSGGTGYNAVAIWPFSGYTGGELPICRTQVGQTQCVLQQTNVSTGVGSEIYANDLTANINWMFSVRYRV